MSAPRSFGTRNYSMNFIPRSYKPTKGYRGRKYYKRKFGKFAPYQRRFSLAPRMVAQTYYKKRRYQKYRGIAASARSVVGGARISAQLATIISPCTKRWLQLLVDPFNGPIDACNPFTPPIMSERYRTWARMTVSSTAFGTTGGGGTAGLAMFAINALSPASNDTVVYGLGTAQTLSTAWNTMGDFGTVRMNSPFVAADFGDGLMAWAPVAAAFRIRYTGRADARMGTMYIYEEDSHADLHQASWTGTGVLGRDNCISMPVSPEWTTVCWSGPRTQYETMYSTNGNVSATGASHAIFALILSGITDADAQSFEIEIVHIWEGYGNQARNMMKSEQDSGGASKVMTALQGLFRNTPMLNTDPGLYVVCVLLLALYIAYQCSCCYFSCVASSSSSGYCSTR